MRHRVRTTLALLALLTGCARPVSAPPDSDTHVYTTWTTLELDKCASAWMIKRFVDTDAVFRFVPKGELITEGIAFDTPGAPYKRTQEQTTFESISAAYDIREPAIEAMARLVHTIEIDYWNGADASDEALVRTVDENMRRIIQTGADEHQALAQCFVYLEQLYEQFKRSTPAN